MNRYRFRCLRRWLLVSMILTAPVALGAASDKLSESTYQHLAEAHKLMEQGAYKDAMGRLDALQPALKGDAYEHAMVLQTYGYLYSAQGERTKAIAALNKSLELKALPPVVSQDVRYLLAQLQMTDADYRGAALNLEQWLSREKKPSPEAHALVGTAHAYLKQQASAEKHLEKALSSAGRHPEDWYRQLLALYFEAKRFDAAARLLQRMIAAFPQRKVYWQQLSGVYSKLNDDHAALAVLELARLQGVLSQERDLVNLAGHFQQQNAPLQAAELLETALRDGAVPSTREHWERLGNAWLQAKEVDRARQAFSQTVQLAADPELHLLRAQLAAQKEDWEAVLESASSALESGRIDRPGAAYLLAGVAHFYNGTPNAALHAFEQARTYEGTHQDAQHWIDFLAPITAEGR